jgi:Smr domain
MLHTSLAAYLRPHLPPIPKSMDPSQYAQYLLESYASSNSCSAGSSAAYVDGSLGSYVVSLLQDENAEDPESSEALVELLQEHCNLSEQLAGEALAQIRNVLTRGIAPSSFYTVGTDQESHSALQSPASPLHEADVLIPGDLLGDLDVESPIRQLQRQPAGELDSRQALPTTNAEEAFPPLSAAAQPTASKKSKPTRGRKLLSNHATGTSAATGAADASEVAASLFRSGPRQITIKEPVLASSAPPQHSLSNQTTDSQPKQVQFAPAMYESLPFDSAVEILLSMNADMSEEAAESACVTAQSDVNLAQYLVDHAMAAPAVCRHLLSSGCYRADCQFSHDLENHTCLFWLKGRCGKGSSCKFKHGFNGGLLDHLFGEDTAEAIQDTFHVNRQHEAFPAPDGEDGSVFATNYVSDRPTTFASVAKGSWQRLDHLAPSGISSTHRSSSFNAPTIKIPIDVWTPHETRDSSVFHVADPLTRYRLVQGGSQREDVIDLHFQSTKTFPSVLSVVLPEKLAKHGKVWIVTGTGHHVGSKTHQKGGGALENAVAEWLQDEGYSYLRGRDRNGQGGAIYVESS